MHIRKRGSPPTQKLSRIKRNRQTSQRKKGRHLSGQALRWRSGIPLNFSFCIPSVHSQGGRIPANPHPFGSVQAHCAGTKPDSGKDPGRSPLRSQSDCKSQRWTGPRPGYWRIANSSCPSQRALCCALRGCWTAPASRPPDSAPDKATVLADSATPCPGQTWAPSWHWHPQPMQKSPSQPHLHAVLAPPCRSFSPTFTH